MKEIEWSEESLDDLAALDKGAARRIKKAVERFAETGSGDVKKLQEGHKLGTTNSGRPQTRPQTPTNSGQHTQTPYPNDN